MASVVPSAMPSMSPSMAETLVEPSGTSATIERAGATGLLKVGVSFEHGRSGDSSVLGVTCLILWFLRLGGLPIGLGAAEVDRERVERWPDIAENKER